MLWVDTDFGFDDLWALLLLQQHGVSLAGVSLVAGNVPLAQAKANALGAIETYGLDLPLYEGADRPLLRTLETAEAILGPTGMQTRGRALPFVPANRPLPAAGSALANWLLSAKDTEPREILAIGPLTNIAQLIDDTPEAAAKITRLVWMGGSNGHGNHTTFAEYNAIADPDATFRVMQANLPLDVVDLTLCRTVNFAADDLPNCDPLTADLLGGYLDIAINRGRDSMAIYDPVAALAIISPEAFESQAMDMAIETQSGDHYGATTFTTNPAAMGHLLTKAPLDAARTCLHALAKKDQ
ncbi:nucleoside hydrolase [Cohaesibacter celericrescens]|uniref:Nucleoside hydrolase n=1 Tax=Cohaesibacter celericrescens TaxID=2067669 RepID=A0A2N5XN43_9HYPH|nr:nucleoside hydrolase [Cohaesibacter celericrescens]PLW75913.1 nucleoside hydrolase [Cohaesibacter celericrescens]